MSDKITIQAAKDMIDNNMFPIIHPLVNVEECITCCSFTKEYLAECSHYLILTGYDHIEFSCRIITRSDKYSNVQVTPEQYVLTKDVKLFKEKGIQYYSSSMYYLPFSCIDIASHKGYFKQM